MDNYGVGKPTDSNHLRSKYLHYPLSIINYPLYIIHLFCDALTNGTFLCIGADFIIAVHIGELAIFCDDANGAAAVQYPAVAAEETFFFHFIPPLCSSP